MVQNMGHSRRSGPRIESGYRQETSSFEDIEDLNRGANDLRERIGFQAGAADQTAVHVG